MKHSQKNMKLSIILVLFGISQVFGNISIKQGACVEGAYCKFTLISNDKSTGKSLSEALLFAEHGENMLCTKIGLNVRNNFCTQHVLPRFELEIFMY